MRDAKQQVEACRASLVAAQEDVDAVAAELAPCIEDLQSRVQVEDVVEMADQVKSLLDSLGCGRYLWKCKTCRWSRTGTGDGHLGSARLQ